jgi:hypothetical protein
LLSEFNGCFDSTFRLRDGGDAAAGQHATFVLGSISDMDSALRSFRRGDKEAASLKAFEDFSVELVSLVVDKAAVADLD